MRYHSKKKKINSAFQLLLIICLGLTYFLVTYREDIVKFIDATPHQVSYEVENIPEYQGDSYVVIDNNTPHFTEEDKLTEEKEVYSDLDSLGRCGTALAKVGIETMPTEKRGSIGMVKPSGWHTVKYDIVNGKYLYNRCHLIGYQLTGENANPKNLITCTRSMNTEGMLEFENKVAKYVEETKNHVLYRVTPIFKGNNLLASGVIMEAESVEDEGKGISFHVYVYNVQKGIHIDYETGNSSLIKEDEK